MNDSLPQLKYIYQQFSALHFPQTAFQIQQEEIKLNFLRFITQIEQNSPNQPIVSNPTTDAINQQFLGITPNAQTTDPIAQFKSIYLQFKNLHFEQPELQGQQEELKRQLLLFLQTLINPTVVPNPSPVDPTPTTPPSPPISKTNLLLFLGAFLIISAVGMFIGYNYNNLSSNFKFVSLLIINILFYYAGLTLYKHNPQLKPAGLTFLVIGLIIFPFSGVGFIKLYPLANPYLVTIIFSLITTLLYAYTYTVIQQRALIYLSSFAFLIFEQAFIQQFQLPTLFAILINISTAFGFFMIGQKNSSSSDDKSAAVSLDFNCISHVIAVFSLTLCANNSQGGTDFYAICAFTFFLLSIFYGYLVSFPQQKDRSFIWQACSLSLCLCFTFLFQTLSLPTYLSCIFLIPINFALAFFGQKWQIISFHKNLIFILFHALIFIALLLSPIELSIQSIPALKSFSTIFNFVPSAMEIFGLAVFCFCSLIEYKYLVNEQNQVISSPKNPELASFFLISTFFSATAFIFHACLTFSPTDFQLTIFCLLLSCLIPLGYSFLTKKNLPLTNLATIIIICASLTFQLFHPLEGVTLLYFLILSNLFFILNYYLHRTSISLYFSLYTPLLIILNLNQLFSFSVAITVALCFSLILLTLYYFSQKNRFAPHFYPALIYQIASLILVFSSASENVNLIYSFIFLLSTLSFLLPFKKTHRWAYAYTAFITLILCFYSLTNYFLPALNENIILLPWSLFFFFVYYSKSHLHSIGINNNPEQDQKGASTALIAACVILLLPNFLHMSTKPYVQLVILLESIALVLLGNNDSRKSMRYLGLVGIITDVIIFVNQFIGNIPSWIILGVVGLIMIGIATANLQKKKQP